MDDDDELRRDVDLLLLKAAKQHDANTRELWQTGPGIGKILRLVLLYEIEDINRFPRVQEFASSCRLVKGATESHGKRAGSAGPKSGKAHRPGAFSAAAVLCLRAHPPRAPTPGPMREETRSGQSLHDCRASIVTGGL
jgi:transposase